MASINNPAQNSQIQNSTTVNIGQAAPIIGNMNVTSTGVSSVYTGAYWMPMSSNTTTNTTSVVNTAIISLSNSSTEIVRLNKDGTVTWANGINIDEAAEAFSRSISVGAELCAGITNTVKQNMRNIVFEEIIDIARTKGSLTADDLTYLLQSAKIVDKLKGKYE